MKLLWLSHRESDFGASFLWHGLCQILGDNIVDYPYKVSHHGQTDLYTWPNGSAGVTCPLPWMPSRGGPNYSAPEIIQMVRERQFDLIVVTPRDQSTDAMRMLIREIGKIEIPVVLCDHEDASRIRRDLQTEFGAKLIFKRELLNDERDCVPLPFSSPADRYPEIPEGQERPIDLLFLMGLTWPMRNQIYDAVRSLRSECNVYAALAPDPDPNNQDEPLPWEKYIEQMGRAKIAVSVRGFGNDTCRYWEIPPTGALMLCDHLPIKIPNPFQEGVHVARYRDPEDFKSKVRHFLSNVEGREKLAAAGREHALKYHTCKARAEWFLENARRVM